MIDLWEKLHPIFEQDGGGQPEIVMVNLKPATMRLLLTDVFGDSRGLVTNFTTIHETPIIFKSTEAAINGLISGDFIGVLSFSLLFEGLKLPSIAFVVEDIDFITLIYEMGQDWTPVAVTALFELFKKIRRIDKEAVIGLSPYQFDKQSRVIFDSILRDYINERYENGLW